MRFVLSAVCVLMLGVSQGRAAGFPPSEAALNELASHFHTMLQNEGISGIGSDVIKCYERTLGDKNAMKMCVVYDTAALMLDKGMQQMFVGRGLNAVPATLFTNQAFDARQNSYGQIAFSDAPGSRKLVGPLAQKVLHRAITPHTY
jgi:hypothetical protein